MIKGIGVDVLEIERFHKLLKNDYFMKKVFSDEEREYIASKKHGAADSAAGIYCAKEAFSKADGAGLSRLLLQEVSVLRKSSVPYISLRGGLAEKYAHCKIQLSISHSKTCAVAMVVIEEADTP